MWSGPAKNSRRDTVVDDGSLKPNDQGEAAADSYNHDEKKGNGKGKSGKFEMSKRLKLMLLRFQHVLKRIWIGCHRVVRVTAHWSVVYYLIGIMRMQYCMKKGT